METNIKNVETIQARTPGAKRANPGEFFFLADLITHLFLVDALKEIE